MNADGTPTIGSKVQWWEQGRDGAFRRVGTLREYMTRANLRVGVIWTNPNGGAMEIDASRLQVAK